MYTIKQFGSFFQVFKGKSPKGKAQPRMGLALWLKKSYETEGGTVSIANPGRVANQGKA